MSLSHRRVHSVSIAIDRDEEMLDHAVSTQQIEAIQKQLWIRGNALADSVRQFTPLPVIIIAPGVFVRLEQRHEILNQQGEIKRIGVASTQHQALLVKRRSLLHGV